MQKTRTCHICGTVCTEACPVCVDRFERRSPAEKMSLEDKIKEIESFRGPMEIPFHKIHLRFEELMGRSIFTHELAFLDLLIEELRQGHLATFDEIVGNIPAEKLIVAIA